MQLWTRKTDSWTYILLWNVIKEGGESLKPFPGGWGLIETLFMLSMQHATLLMTVCNIGHYFNMSTKFGIVCPKDGSGYVNSWDGTKVSVAVAFVVGCLLLSLTHKGLPLFSALDREVKSKVTDWVEPNMTIPRSYPDNKATKHSTSHYHSLWEPDKEPVQPFSP